MTGTDIREFIEICNICKYETFCHQSIELEFIGGFVSWCRVLHSGGGGVEHGGWRGGGGGGGGYTMYEGFPRLWSPLTSITGKDFTNVSPVMTCIEVICAHLHVFKVIWAHLYWFKPNWGQL